jgi:hypothetical protein
MKRLVLVNVFVLACAAAASGQTFSSGSTGADGALAPPQGGEFWIQLPPSGILNYTTIDVPQYTIVKFIRNGQNTPVIVLATGDVNIRGEFNVSGGGLNPHGNQDYTIGGPGGFDGAKTAGATGQGPSPGQPGEDNRASWIGPLSLVPSIGGSGGGSGGVFTPLGGGGGGAITIASSGAITLFSSGTIAAQAATPGYAGAMGGAGGAIRLVANTITIEEPYGALWARGAANVSASLPGNNGLIRLEGGTVSFKGRAEPAPVIAAINNSIVPANPPTLAITSIGGFPVPATAGSRVDTADLVLPKQLADPISVVVAAANIPIGTPITASFGAGSGTVTPGVLDGASSAATTGTVQISGMARDGTVTFIYVTAIFTVPGGGSAANPPGADHVANVRLRAEPGRPTTYAFLRADGSEIERSRLPRAFLSQFER